MDTVALILLVAPTALLLLYRIRDSGLAVDLFSVGAMVSAVGFVLLVGIVFLSYSQSLSGLFESEFLPAQILMLFLISGLAFGAAIFPRQAIELSGMSRNVQALRIEWLFVLLAWMWIAVLYVLVL